MAYTYSWQDVVTPAKKILKNVGGFDDIAVLVCDMTSSDMYVAYPWKDTITTIATNTIPLLDSTQDYSSPINIYRLIKATILRTDTTPFDTIDLDIVDDNAINTTPRSYSAIRSVSQQQATGTLRLESAVTVPSGTLLQLIGEYQLNPVKIAALGQQLWFKDQYINVALQGVLYWGKKLSDDPSAGEPITDSNGNIVRYSGQLGAYKASLYQMRMAEDYGAQDGLFPSEPMGVGRDYNSLMIFGF